MNTINALYEQDYFLWLEETYKLLENNRIEELDFLHLKEEILSLGNIDNTLSIFCRSG
jgi:hypothetical protein